MSNKRGKDIQRAIKLSFLTHEGEIKQKTDLVDHVEVGR